MPPVREYLIDEHVIEQMRDLTSSPTTAENFEERKAFLVSRLVPVGLLMTLSVEELQEAYQVWAALNDPEKSKDTETAAKYLDRVLAIFGRHLDEIDLEAFNE